MAKKTSMDVPAWPIGCSDQAKCKKNLRCDYIGCPHRMKQNLKAEINKHIDKKRRNG